MAKQRKRMTLRYLNEKYAGPLGLELFRGEGYFYVQPIDLHSYIDTEEGTMILLYRMNDFSEAQWKEELEFKASCIVKVGEEKSHIANNQGMGGPYG